MTLTNDLLTSHLSCSMPYRRWLTHDTEESCFWSPWQACVHLQPVSPSSDVAFEATQSQMRTEQPAANLHVWTSLHWSCWRKNSVQAQCQKLSAVKQPLQHCPLTWWKEHCGQYPRIAKVAQRYLSAPPMSVASKWLYSTAGNLYSDQR